MLEIKIEKSILEGAVGKVVKAVNHRAIMPVLTGIKIEAKAGVLTLVASDMDLSITSRVHEELIVSSEGAIVVPAKEFSSIVKSLPNEEISIKVQEGEKVQIKAGKSNFKLNGIEAEEFPKIKLENATDSFKIESNVLANTIKKSIFAVSKVETRPVLTGVNFQNNEGELTVVATDSHRLSKVKPNVNVNFEESFTIPAKSLKEIPSLFKLGEVTISKAKNNIVVEGDDTVVVLRTLTNNYPDTTRLIPNNDRTIVKVNRMNFINSLERAGILAKHDNKLVTFIVSDENKGIFDTIQLKQKTKEVGLSMEDIVVNDIEGEEIEISFNVTYAIDALKAIDSDEVVLSFGGAIKPFTILGTENQDTLQLILPVRTK